MTKTICKTVYDTDNAVVVKKFTSGFLGDPAGYEEVLYQTETGSYVIYDNGGPESPYPPADIKRIAKTKGDAWIAERE